MVTVFKCMAKVHGKICAPLLHSHPCNFHTSQWTDFYPDFFLLDDVGSGPYHISSKPSACIALQKDSNSCCQASACSPHTHSCSYTKLLPSACSPHTHSTLCPQFRTLSMRYLRNENKNYAGSKTLPASIKKKETHWPDVPWASPTNLCGTLSDLMSCAD